MPTDTGLSAPSALAPLQAEGAAAAAPSPAPRPAGRHPGTVVAQRTARAALRSGALWGVVFGVYTAMQALAYVDSYPTQRSRDIMAQTFSSGGLNALMGPAHGLATVGGFTAWKSIGILSVVGAVWALLLSTKLLRGEEDAGRWELLVSGQTTRRHAAAQALGGLGAGLAALWAVTAACDVAVGQEHKVAIGAGPSLYFALCSVCAAAVFLAAGALCSQLAASRRQAAGYAGALLGVFYALRMVADSSHGLSWMSWLTPLGWIDRLQPLTDPHPAVLIPILALTLALAGLAVALAGRRDLGASVFPDRGHATAHTALLGNPLGLAVRLSRATTLAWLAAICALALLYGGVATEAVKSLASSPSSTQIVERLGGQATEMKSYLALVFLILTVLVAFVAANHVTAARREEATGRLEHLLVRPVSRTEWIGGRTGLATVTVVVAALAGGVFVWIGTMNQATGVGLRAMLGAALNGVPPVLLLLGVGMLALGVAPRLADFTVYAVLSWSFLVTFLGGFLNSNHWLLDTSLFHQMRPAPAVAPDWRSGSVMLALAAAAAGTGRVGAAAPGPGGRMSGDLGTSGSHDHLEAIDRDECVRHLQSRGVGRLGVVVGGRVGVFPVNYTLEGDSVVVRVRHDGALDEATRDAFVALQIDHADPLYHEGWSVLVQGRCRHVTDAWELAALARLPLLPWGGTDRDLFLRIPMEKVGGRHIHHRDV